MKNEIINYVEYLFALALKMCGDVNNAEDLTQETLLTAFQYINRGGNISNMKYWLTSVLSNKWNEALRQKYRLPLVSVDVIPDVRITMMKMMLTDLKYHIWRSCKEK